MLPGHFIPPKDQSGAAFWPVNLLFWLLHQNLGSFCIYRR